MYAISYVHWTYDMTYIIYAIYNILAINRNRIDTIIDSRTIYGTYTMTYINIFYYIYPYPPHSFIMHNINTHITEQYRSIRSLLLHISNVEWMSHPLFLRSTVDLLTSTSIGTANVVDQMDVSIEITFGNH